MKTNRFDEILRRKLESIRPDFQDQSWDTWNAFRQQASPGFWHTYGPWVGYAVATLTTVVMGVLYTNQFDQNQNLLKELREIKQQIAAQKQTDQSTLDTVSAGKFHPIELPRTKTISPNHSDTLYSVERRIVHLDPPARVAITENQEREALLQGTESIPVEERRSKGAVSLPDSTVSPETEATFDKSGRDSNERLPLAGKTDSAPSVLKRAPGSASMEQATDAKLAKGKVPGSKSKAEPGRIPKDTEPAVLVRLDLGEVAPLPPPSYIPWPPVSLRGLQSRLPEEGRVVTMQRVARLDNTGGVEQKSIRSAPPQKIEKVGKDESLLPAFGLGLPYRVGIGQQWKGRAKSFGFWNELLLGEHFSVQTGLSWLKLEDQKFFNDRIFRDKTQEEFRKKHAKPLPPNFDIFNITVRTTLLRVPLNLTYRTELGRNFALFAGAGTHLNLRAKQTLSFDFKRPTNDFGQQMTERAVAVPLIKTMNVLLGTEKRWSPIVLQASVSLNTGLRASSYLHDKTHAGAQVKILYELGTTKK